MCSATDLAQRIAAFHDRAVASPHHRYLSWEHCYRFFRARSQDALLKDKDAAALQLGFYLASWGMYRGSSFLLQRSYTIHVAVVERLASPELSKLWDTEVGSAASDAALVPTILSAVDAVRQAYAPFGAATDTLATKVILGTLGCLPAVDRFFIDGFKKSGRQYSRINTRFVERIIQFCLECGSGLCVEQDRIEKRSGLRYPLMKLADMYFWEIGYAAALKQPGGDPELMD